MGYEAKVINVLRDNKIAGSFVDGILYMKEGDIKKAKNALMAYRGIYTLPEIKDEREFYELKVVCKVCGRTQFVLPAKVIYEEGAIYGSSADFCEECGSSEVTGTMTHAKK